jgi:hypothetical protein
VQRPFEDGYDPTQPFYASWGVDEAAARAIYGLGVYAATPTNSPNASVWSAIAGLSWRVPPGCDASQTNEPTQIYDLAGLEPLSIATDQNGTRVTVRPTGRGLYAIMLSPQGGVPNMPKRVLFVDESGAPIAQCDALSGELSLFGACQRD